VEQRIGYTVGGSACQSCDLAGSADSRFESTLGQFKLGYLLRRFCLSDRPAGSNSGRAGLLPLHPEEEATGSRRLSSAIALLSASVQPVVSLSSRFEAPNFQGYSGLALLEHLNAHMLATAGTPVNEPVLHAIVPSWYFVKSFSEWYLGETLYTGNMGTSRVLGCLVADVFISGNRTFAGSSACDFGDAVRSMDILECKLRCSGDWAVERCMDLLPVFAERAHCHTCSSGSGRGANTKCSEDELARW